MFTKILTPTPAPPLSPGRAGPTPHVPPAHQSATIHLPGPSQPVLAPCEYKTGKTLGQGSYATVKEAVHVKTGKRYAVKVISKQLMKGKEAMILNEIEVLKRISKGHPNIVTLWDYFETPNNLYLVMDLCVGGELFDRICDKGSYYEEDAAAIVRVVVDAVGYLHGQGVVHRDIKAENLLFRTRESSDPKDLLIADFGLSKIIDDGQYHLLMTTCGTPGYMAPEVIRRVGHHKPVDMWSVGVLTYFLLCGYTPFDATTQAEEIQNILKGKYSFEPREYWEDVSEEAKDFIRKLLVINPKDRLNAADALVHPFLAPPAMFPDPASFGTTPVGIIPYGSVESMEGIVPTPMPMMANTSAGVPVPGSYAPPVGYPTSAQPPISPTVPGAPNGMPVPLPALPVPFPPQYLAASAPPDFILRQMGIAVPGRTGAPTGPTPTPAPAHAMPMGGAMSYMDQSALAALYGVTPGSGALFGTSLPSSRERVNLLPHVRKNLTAKQRLRRAAVVVEAANRLGGSTASLTASRSSLASAGASTSQGPATAPPVAIADSSIRVSEGTAAPAGHGRNGSEGEGGHSPMLVATRRPAGAGEVSVLSGLSMGLSAANANGSGDGNGAGNGGQAR